MAHVFAIGHQHRRLIPFGGAGDFNVAHPLPSESMAAQQSAVVGACHRVHTLPEIRHMVKPHQIKQSVREP